MILEKERLLLPLLGMLAMTDEHSSPPRMARERQTIASMIDLYCHAHHSPQDGLCAECAALRDYAFCRLDRCPFGAEKPTCAKCPIHCYKPEMREKVKEVMRYAGPRMLLHHPVLSLLHQLDSLRGRPSRPSKSH
jgi:hypothetical protein